MAATTLERCNVFLDDYYQQKKLVPCKVIEAGGGSFSHFHLPPDAELFLLDISYEQLIRNEHSSYRIQGDVQRFPVRPGALGMAVCFNVIEHVEHPQSAVSEMVAALAPDGLLVLGCPERASLKGLVTRFTPIWFHRWYYKVVVGKKDRGEGHFDAFETPFKPLVSAKRLTRFLQEQDMEILFLRCYDGAQEYDITGGGWKQKMFAIPYYGIGWLGRLFSFGLWNPLSSDILLVARKKS